MSDHVPSVLDDVDMDKLNEMLDKYKLPYNRKLEEYNENILKIMRMQFPPTEELDDYDKKLQEEIKATEDYLVEHNEFLSKTMNYCGYISNKRKQVENRLAIIEKKFRKKFNPKVDKSFMEVMELKKEYDQIPEIKKKMLDEHHERMKKLKNELEMTKAKTREYFYKEKDLLAEIASKDEKVDGVRKKIDEMNSKINEYHQEKERVYSLENNEIPDLCKAIDAIKIEIKEQEELNADEINKFETYKSLYESVTEQINALEQDFENKCIQIRELQEMIQTITTKSTLFDLEVDERFQNIVNTEFFQQEKSRLLQLKVDNMSIASDINTYRNDVNEAKLEVQKLNEEIARDKLKEKNSQLKSELSQLVKLEMDKMEETRQLKARLEAEKEAYFKSIDDMEKQISKLINRKIEIENITDAQVSKLLIESSKKDDKASGKQKEGPTSKKLKLGVPNDSAAKFNSQTITGAIPKNHPVQLLENKSKQKVRRSEYYQPKYIESTSSIDGQNDEPNTDTVIKTQKQIRNLANNVSVDGQANSHKFAPTQAKSTSKQGDRSKSESCELSKPMQYDISNRNLTSVQEDQNLEKICDLTYNMTYSNLPKSSRRKSCNNDHPPVESSSTSSVDEGPQKIFRTKSTESYLESKYLKTKVPIDSCKLSKPPQNENSNRNQTYSISADSQIAKTHRDLTAKASSEKMKLESDVNNKNPGKIQQQLETYKNSQADASSGRSKRTNRKTSPSRPIPAQGSTSSLTESKSKKEIIRRASVPVYEISSTSSLDEGPQKILRTKSTESFLESKNLEAKHQDMKTNDKHKASSQWLPAEKSSSSSLESDQQYHFKYNPYFTDIESSEIDLNDLDFGETEYDTSMNLE